MVKVTLFYMLREGGMMISNSSFCFVIHNNIGGLGLFLMMLLCSCQVCVIVRIIGV